MSSNTIPAELRAPEGGPTPSGARGDPASDVAARRLAWQRAFESALRLPWCGPGNLGASAEAPSARPALIARPPPARDASDAAPSASREETGRREVPAPARSATVGRLGLAPSPEAPPGAQRGRAVEEDAPRPPWVAEYEAPRPRDASLASCTFDSVAPREALASIRGGAENGFKNQETRPGGAVEDPRGRSAWVRAPAREEPDPGRLLVPGSATVAGGQRHRATASGRPEPTKPAAAKAVYSPVPVSACAGTPLAGLAPGASGPAADHLEPPLEERLPVRELRLSSSGARPEGGAASAREPVRCHAEWGEDGVRVWIGLDQDREQSQPQLTRALVEQARTLVEAQGGRVLTVICNGKVVWGRRPPAGSRPVHCQASRRDWYGGPVDVSSKEES